MLEQAREEARDIINDAKQVSEEVKEELKELAKLESLGERNKKFDENRKRIKDAAGRYKETFIAETNDAPVILRKPKRSPDYLILERALHSTLTDIAFSFFTVRPSFSLRPFPWSSHRWKYRWRWVRQSG